MKGFNYIDALVILISFLTLVVMFFILRFFAENAELNSRLKKLKDVNKDALPAFDLAHPNPKEMASEKEIEETLFAKTIKLKDNFFLRYIQQLSKETGQEYKNYFDRAGWSTPNASLIAVIVKFLSLIIFGMGAVIFIENVEFLTDQRTIVKLAIIIAALLLGFRLFDFVLRSLVKQRYKRIARDLPHALDLLVLCSKAGLSIDRGFEYTAEEIGGFNNDLCKEFAVTFLELNMLPSRQTVYMDLARRVNLPLITALATTLIQAEEQGTSISQTLTVLAEEYHKQRLLEAEAKAAQIATLLTIPTITFILPSLMIILLGPAIVKILKNFLT